MGDAEEWLSRPLTDLVSGVARSVAEGQTALDRQSLSTARELREAVEAGELEIPLDAPWFRFADVEADITVSLSVEARPERDDDGQVRAYRQYLVATPTNPRLTNTYDYDVAAASRVSVSIVPVPSPE
jgi:hypothetical protein